MAVGISVVLATLLLAFAWLERSLFERPRPLPVLTFLGIGVVFVGHFYLLDALGGRAALRIWPACPLRTGL